MADNSKVESSFREGAGLKPRTAADPEAPVRAGRKKCPPGKVFKNGRCVRYDPGYNPTRKSQTTGP